MTEITLKQGGGLIVRIDIKDFLQSSIGSSLGNIGWIGITSGVSGSGLSKDFGADYTEGIIEIKIPRGNLLPDPDDRGDGVEIEINLGATDQLKDGGTLIYTYYTIGNASNYKDFVLQIPIGGWMVQNIHYD